MFRQSNHLTSFSRGIVDLPDKVQYTESRCWHVIGNRKILDTKEGCSMLRIEKPRLLCGVLGEIAVRNIPVEIARDDTREYSASAYLALDIDAGFRNARIRLTDTEEATVSGKTVFCKAEYFGNTIFFTLTKNDASETYPLPEWIEADHWYVPEIVLPQYEFPTDICYPHGGLMGYAVKLTPDSVVIAVDTTDFSPQKNFPFHITFRHRTKN